jgi:hypothetical protein
MLVARYLKYTLVASLTRKVSESCKIRLMRNVARIRKQVPRHSVLPIGHYCLFGNCYFLNSPHLAKPRLA